MWNPSVTWKPSSVQIIATENNTNAIYYKIEIQVYYQDKLFY
jgi:hypothetical protein